VGPYDTIFHCNIPR